MGYNPWGRKELDMTKLLTYLIYTEINTTQKYLMSMCMQYCATDNMGYTGKHGMATELKELSIQQRMQDMFINNY